MNVKIIIGFAEALSAPEVAWSLVDHGFNVVAFSRKGRRPSLRHSRFVHVFEITPPEVDLSRAIDQLKLEAIRLKETSGVLALMPLDDEAVWLCGRADFGSEIIVIGPRGEAVEIALNKQKQIEIAQTAGFCVPPTSYVEHVEDVRPREVNFPIVFKPAVAVVKSDLALSKGQSWICSDRAELESAVDSWGGKMPMLIQQFIPGIGEGLFGLATHRGVLVWSAHQRLRMMNPHGSGASACMVAPKMDQQSKSIAERFVECCGWRGLFMIEMLRDKSGNLWFIEFNGRSWGSMALARRIGLEYPAWAVQTILTPNALMDISVAHDCSLVCRHLGREMLYVLFVLRGSKSKALTSWPSIWSALFQVFRIGRNHRWYNWRKDDPKVFFYDCYNTLREQLFKSSRCQP
jgi:predicted ATP-grasp superfamily ATP-dependent carboligase